MCRYIAATKKKKKKIKWDHKVKSNANKKTTAETQVRQHQPACNTGLL